MRKTMFLLLALMLCVSQAFAAVGYWDKGSPVGSATDLDVYGGVKSFDGSKLTLSMIGPNRGGLASQYATVTAAISLAYAKIDLIVSSTVGTVNTLAAGTPGQILTIEVVARGGSGTSNITPAQPSGFNYVSTGAVGSYVTFLYLNATSGWIIIGSQGVTIT